MITAGFIYHTVLLLSGFPIIPSFSNSRGLPTELFEVLGASPWQYCQIYEVPAALRRRPCTLKFVVAVV
jgi:hypothetical protein